MNLLRWTFFTRKSPRSCRRSEILLAASAVAVTFVGLAATAHADAPVNLVVTDAVRAQLLEAGAALKGFPVSDFFGLQPGQTYYAYDPDTGTYWAGARLGPHFDSEDAKIADQGVGIYTLFEQPSGKPWKAYSDGLGRGGQCPVPLPVMRMWGWDEQLCKPSVR
jgi:hypothetical protein